MLPFWQHRFWATICKTVCPILSDRCLSVLSCQSCPVLSVMLVYCGQDETWHAGRPRPWPHCVIWGPSSPSPKGAQPANFLSISVVAKWLAGWIKMSLGMREASAQATLCYMGTQPPSPKSGGAPNFRLTSIVAKRLDGSRCHLVRR